MATVKHIITHVSRQLNDQRKNKQFTRWTQADLLEYLNQALKEIAAYRPEAFAKTLALALVPGKTQTVPEGTTLRGFAADTNGNTAYSTDDTLLKAFGAYAACPPKTVMKDGKVVYNVKTFSVDSIDPKTFYVSPPVPSGVAITVQAQVDGDAPEFSLADWNKEVAIQDKFYNSILVYMTAMAYKLDSESVVSVQEAQRLLQLFYQVMGVKYKIDSARNSGYYNGEIGTGDPRSVIR